MDESGDAYPEWTHSNLLELSQNGFSNGVFNDPKKVGKGYRLINVLDMYIPSTIDDTKLSKVDIDITEFKKNKVECGDIFFTRSSLVKEGIAYSNVYLGNSEDITFDGHLIRLRPNKDLINPSCFNYLLRTKAVRNQLVMRGKTATMTTIGQADIASVYVDFPSKQEQTKIANFLTAVDNKISQLTKKHKLLILYKKGIMQKIFSQELRFKDDEGQEFPDWKFDALGNLSDVRDGTHESPSFINIGYPLITSKNLLIDGSLDEVTVNFICEKDFNNFNKRSKVNIGDILFGMIGTIGNPVQVKSSNFAIKNVALIKEMGSLNNSFLTQYLKSSSIIKKLEALKTGNTQKFISLSNLRSIEIACPCSAEQTKIAKFLTAIDDKLSNVKSQLEAAKDYKRGLLQQMFV